MYTHVCLSISLSLYIYTYMSLFLSLSIYVYIHICIWTTTINTCISHKLQVVVRIPPEEPSEPMGGVAEYSSSINVK